MDVLQPGDPKNPAARVKASKIRNKMGRGSASPEEIAWLNDYDATREPESRGASAHRKVSYTEEESAAAGTGEAASVAAHAAMIREEGRQETSLADRGMMALERAFARQERMVEFMMARMQTLEDSHLSMWAAHRDSRIREVDAEIALMQAEAEKEEKPDQISAMAAELLPLMMKQLQQKGGK